MRTHSHMHCRPIGWGSVWKGVVLTHWLSGMLQPQHLTGPYLPWADCAAWYASVIFVGKKDTVVRARWVKKTGQWHKLTSLRFLHDHDHFLSALYSLVEKTLNTKQVQCSYGCLILSTGICIFFVCGYHRTPDHWQCLHACTGVHLYIVHCSRQSCRPVRKHEAKSRLPSFHRGHHHDDR